MTKVPDANDILRESGAEGLRLAFDASRPKPRETKRNTGRRGRLLPIVELVDMSTASRKAWCVHHLLGLGETSIWYGEPGSGKSVVIGDVGLHVAAGRTWHGRQVKQGAVLYIALERAAVVARRAIALRSELALGPVPFGLARGPLDLREPQTALDVVETISRLADRHRCEPALIIIDTVSRALCGGDENSPKDMGLLVADLARIQQGVGVHLALTHHQPVDGKERMRGHGALLGAADTTVHVTKNDTARLAEVVKSSDHEEGQRVAFTLKSVIVDQDEFGDLVTAPVVAEADAPEAATASAQRTAARIPKNSKLALNALREAVDEAGERVTSNHVPPALRVTTVDLWREYAFKRGIGGQDPDARRKAFKRAVENLASDRLVGMWEPYAWPIA